MREEGHLYIIAAPSGTGKTTLVKSLIENIPNLTVSISHTTRAKRPNEIDNVNYHFVTRETFNDMIAHDDFLEYATIFDNLYGTSKSKVNEVLAKGIDVILEIDWQGHRQIKQMYPDAISIFILPPSQKDLHFRLTHRNQDSAEIITKRLADVAVAVSHANEFDYWVINDDFDQALHDLQALIESGRLKQARQVVKYAELVKGLSQR